MTKFLHISYTENELFTTEHETFESAVKGLLSDILDELNYSFADDIATGEHTDVEAQFKSTIEDCLKNDAPLTKLVQFNNAEMFDNQIGLYVNIKNKDASGWYSYNDLYESSVYQIKNL